MHNCAQVLFEPVVGPLQNLPKNHLRDGRVPSGVDVVLDGPCVLSIDDVLQRLKKVSLEIVKWNIMDARNEPGTDSYL